MRRIALLLLLATWVLPAAARADVRLVEGTPTPGYVNLAASGTGALRIVEVVDGTDVDVAAEPAANGITALSPWTCRTTRTYAAVADGERSAPLAVTTPSCADRISVHLGKGITQGGNIRVSLFDQWHRGDLVLDVCATRPGGGRSCRHIETPDFQFIAHAVFRATRAGEWRIEMRDATQTTRKTVVVTQKHYPAGQPKVLATGDSLMLTPTVALRHRLPGVRLIDDVYAGSGISRPFVIDWAKLPGKQVRAYKPDATVISLGMGDGRDIDGAECCGPDYVTAYAARVKTILRTYARGRKGAVVWLNDPLPSDPVRWPVETAINTAVDIAAQGFPRLKVVDLASLMTPGGTYTPFLDQDGTKRRVRSADGIHLNKAGARIAARLAVSALRRLGVKVG